MNQRLSTCRLTGVLLCIFVAASGVQADESSTVAIAERKASELSVAPSSHRELPADRPAWIDESPVLEGDEHRWPVVSAPCRTKELAEESLKINLRAALETYIETLTGEEIASTVFTADETWINEHRDDDRMYEGTIKEGDETLYEMATVLEFDEEDQAEIKKSWRQHVVGQRFAALAVLVGGAATMLVGATAGLSLVTRRAERRVAQP